MRSVALVFQPMIPEARRLAERCADVAQASGYDTRLLSAWELSPATESRAVRLAVTFGGDGTIIRAARWLAGTETPILGVAMGKLGFLTELPPDQVLERLPSVLDGDYWVDERAMLSARLDPPPGPGRPNSAPGGRADSEDGDSPLLALNDVVIARGASPRVVQIEVSVDGVHLVHYVADGLIVSTPTGSTAYAFAAGGAVVAPHVQALELVPVAAHLSALRSLIVPITARVDVVCSSDQPVLLVLDGQRQVPLSKHQKVTVEVAAEKTHFARLGSPSRFYETLVDSLKKR